MQKCSLFTKSGGVIKGTWLDDEIAKLEWIPKLPEVKHSVGRVIVQTPKLPQPYQQCKKCRSVLDLDGDYCSDCVFGTGSGEE